MLSASRVTLSLALISIACSSDTSNALDAGDTSSNAGHGSSAGQAAIGGHAGAGSGAANGGNSGAGTAAANGGHSGAAGNSVVAGSGGKLGAGGRAGAGGSSGTYLGPSVGSAKRFAALAYNSITTANVSTVVGDIGVSAAAISVITGFDDPSFAKYGNDSLAPNDGLTGLAQGDVTSLVGAIDPRACDTDLTNVVGGLTGDVTLHPGVTCMNSFSADVLVNGHVYLDAGGDANAFFVIRGNKTLTVADGAAVVLLNNARDCGVFWRISEAVTIGKTVAFHGTVIAGTAITMQTASTLNGRALAQTAGVQLDANDIKAPTDSECPHAQ